MDQLGEPAGDALVEEDAHSGAAGDRRLSVMQNAQGLLSRNARKLVEEVVQRFARLKVPVTRETRWLGEGSPKRRSNAR